MWSLAPVALQACRKDIELARNKLELLIKQSTALHPNSSCLHARDSPSSLPAFALSFPSPTHLPAWPAPAWPAPAQAGSICRTGAGFTVIPDKGNRVH